MKLLKIEKYSHGVRVSEYSEETYRLIKPFLTTLMLRELENIPRTNRKMMVTKKVYYGETKDRKQLFIHRYCLNDLLRHLVDNNIYSNQIEIVELPVPTAQPAEFKLFDKYVLRDYQQIIQDDILRPIQSARIDLQTGKGKTLVSLATVSKLQCKTLAMLPPKYFGLWDTALEDTYHDIKDRVLTVAGSDSLKKVIDRALDDDLKGIDFFMVSNTTYRAYIDAFELHGDNLASIGYNVPPTRFHELLGVGCQINDEIQEDPGLLFRIDLYTNVAKQIYLSATPFTGNKYVTKMIDVMLPEETKVRLPDLSVYINCMGLVYSDIGIKPKDYLTPFKNTYNHARYETQMMLNNKRHTRYKALIKKAVMALFVRDRLPQQKMLLLCATVAFINDMVEFLRSEFPELEINEHVSGSPYERLLTNDITVSTIKSSGTGVDIPNLRETFLLQASGSEKDKIQILGRTRPLKLYPDVDPRMTYLICEQIPQHLKYSTETQRIFKPRTLDMSIKRISI